MANPLPASHRTSAPPGAKHFQVINSVANMVGAAGVGSEAVAIWGARGVAAVVGVLTITILVFGEILPKTPVRGEAAINHCQL